MSSKRGLPYTPSRPERNLSTYHGFFDAAGDAPVDVAVARGSRSDTMQAMDDLRSDAAPTQGNLGALGSTFPSSAVTDPNSWRVRVAAAGGYGAVRRARRSRRRRAGATMSMRVAVPRGRRRVRFARSGYQPPLVQAMVPMYQGPRRRSYRRHGKSTDAALYRAIAQAVAASSS
jgi:hypothetical protein